MMGETPRNTGQRGGTVHCRAVYFQPSSCGLPTHDASNSVPVYTSDAAFIQGDRHNYPTSASWPTAQLLVRTSLDIDSRKSEVLHLAKSQKRRQKREFSSVGLLTTERTGEGIEKFPANILLLARAFQHLRVPASVESSRDVTHEHNTIPVGVCLRPSRTEQGCGTRRGVRSTGLERLAQGIYL